MHQLSVERDVPDRALRSVVDLRAGQHVDLRRLDRLVDRDQLDRVYEALVHWGDVFVIATPIRWGNASSLYYKMVERMNCVQNQVTIADRVLIRDKVVGAIITGGQDNVQGVAGHVLGFFA